MAINFQIIDLCSFIHKLGTNWKTTNCQQCPDGLNNCTECLSGYVLLPDHTCGTSCPQDFFSSNKKCISTNVRINDALKDIIAAGERVIGSLAGILYFIIILMIFSVFFVLFIVFLNFFSYFCVIIFKSLNCEITVSIAKVMTEFFGP